MLDDVPDRGEEDEPDDHPRDKAEPYLEDAVAQLTQVIHEGHAAIGVLLPLSAHVTLAYDAGALNGAGEFRHDRIPGMPGLAGLLGSRWLRRHAGQVCGVSGGRPLQVTDLLL